MEYVIRLFKLYDDKGILILLYLIGLILILVFEKNKQHKTVMVYGAWYLPLVILNPLLGIILSQIKIMNTSDTVARLTRIYWLLPVFWVIAYGFALFVRKIRSCFGKWYETIALLFVIFCLIAVGVPVFTKENFIRTENPYKIPQDVIEVVNLINADYEAGFSENRKTVLPDELASYARLYDTSFPLLFGRYPETYETGTIYNSMRQQILDMQVIADGAMAQDCGYLVLDSEKPCSNAPENAVAVFFAETGKYRLYRLERKN